jgi:ribonuclease Y
MDSAVIAVLAAVVALAAGLAVGYQLRRRNTAADEEAARLQAEKLLAEARAKQKELLLEAKDETLRLRNAADAELRERRTEVQRMERRLEQKEQNLDRRIEDLERRTQQLQTRDRQIESRLEEIEQVKLSQLRELERVSNLTHDEAPQHGHSALRGRAGSRNNRRRGSDPERGNEGADHWPRGAQHSSARGCDGS